MKSLQLALLTIVVAAATGCRNSKPSALAPQSTPSLAAISEQKTALLASEVAKNPDPVGAKPVQITPPASMSVVAGNESLEFTVQGHKGQFLRVQMAADDHQALTARISAESETSPGPLKSITPEYCTEDSLFPLPEDGVFRISLAPEGHKEVKLDFSLLAQNDPLVDAGIRPAQISFDDNKELEPIPYDHGCEPGESWPASLSSKSGKLVLRIAQFAGYKSMFPKDKVMEVLISSLAPGAAAPDAKNLPYSNWGGDAATIMTARPLPLEGNDWKAWRWIEGSSQDGDYPGAISYVVEGLTNDGRFFFRMTGQIDHPNVKRLDPRNTRADKQDTPSRLRLEKSLAAADPASFTPNLNELDATATSLVIRK